MTSIEEFEAKVLGGGGAGSVTTGHAREAIALRDRAIDALRPSARELATELGCDTAGKSDVLARRLEAIVRHLERPMPEHPAPPFELWAYRAHVNAKLEPLRGARSVYEPAERLGQWLATSSDDMGVVRDIPVDAVQRSANLRAAEYATARDVLVDLDVVRLERSAGLPFEYHLVMPVGAVSR